MGVRERRAGGNFKGQGEYEMVDIIDWYNDAYVNNIERLFCLETVYMSKDGNRCWQIPNDTFKEIDGILEQLVYEKGERDD